MYFDTVKYGMKCTHCSYDCLIKKKKTAEFNQIQSYLYNAGYSVLRAVVYKPIENFIDLVTLTILNGSF